MAIHASTQMTVCGTDYGKWLRDHGASRIVTPRELDLSEIADMKQQTGVEIETFVHGALCYCYSGQCLMSSMIGGRSGNRGRCAQPCRLPWTFHSDSREKSGYLLSPKDLCSLQLLPDLINAGVDSLKIEGRLKDISYVKNVTAYYRKKLDAVFKRRTEYIRASSGTVKTDFKPQLDKSFSRGFTNYFLFERNKDIFSFDTPKSLGEEMGTVKEIRGNYLTVAGVKSFNNGDGVCYLDENGKLQGFRINRVENNKLFPQEMPRIKPRTLLYRNFDQEFDRQMQRKSAERKLSVALVLAENNFGFTLTLTDEDDNSVSVVLERGKELARTPQTDNLRTQLGKLGNTPFEPARIDIDFSENWFIPASAIAELRRSGVEKLLEVRRINYRRELYKLPETHHSFPATELTYLGNVMNDRAYSFYQNHGVQRIAPAFEKVSADNAVLMFCKHCLRYSMGWCPTYHKVRSPYKEPYYLVSADGKRFRLEFDCKHCQMKVLSASDEPKLSSSHYQA